MISPDQFSAYLKLQQYLLSVEDSSNLISVLLTQMFNHFSSLSFGCQFVGAVAVDLNNKVYKDYFVELDTATNLPTLKQHMLNSSVIFDRKGKIEGDLLLEKTVIMENASLLLPANYPNINNVKTIIIKPLIMARKLDGVFILGFTKEASLIPQRDLDFLQITNNLLTMAYRLQDTQASFVKVSEEVYKMNVKLHQLDKLKDDFVSVASHELRTPMTAIRSYVWMALNKSDVILTDRMKKYLSRTLISTERLINLVNDMLNVSRIESGRVEIKPQVFNIQALVDDVLVEVGPKATEKMIKLESIKIKVPEVFADPDKVHQVLLNLIGNSLKFVPTEGLVTISFFSDGKVVEVAVKDNGVGIDEDDLGSLFQKFGRLDNSYVATATSGGTGLGLYISKSLIELMHGKIWAASEGIGKGATFTFSLPAAVPEVLANAGIYTKQSVGEAKNLEPVAV